MYYHNPEAADLAHRREYAIAGSEFNQQLWQVIEKAQDLLYPEDQLFSLDIRCAVDERTMVVERSFAYVDTGLHMDVEGWPWTEVQCTIGHTVNRQFKTEQFQVGLHWLLRTINGVGSSFITTYDIDCYGERQAEATVRAFDPVQNSYATLPATAYDLADIMGQLSHLNEVVIEPHYDRF